MTEKEKLTEDRIFDAATEVFEEKGMDGARMKDIADRAGINKALLHYYFRTKDLLFDAVFQKLAGKLFAKFLPLFREDLTLEDKLRIFYREHIEFMKQNPRIPAFVVMEINRSPARVMKLLKKVDFKKLWEKMYELHREELLKYNISREDLPQIMTSIAAMSVFPFIARGILEGIFEHMGTDFNKYIEERKNFAPDFVIGALKSRIK